MTTDAVQFPDGETGSSLLRAALSDAVSTHPDVFGGLAVPGMGRAFKQAWPDFVGEFEARRIASPVRLDVARQLASFLPSRTHFGDRTLAESLGRGVAGEPEERRGTASPGWTPVIEWNGRTFEGAAIADFATELRAARQVTEEGARALTWVAETLLQEPLVLDDHRFALLGAAAELAPTRFLLAAGARVLWVDRQAPELAPDGFAGTLVHVPGAADLLTDTPSIAAAVAREAAAGPLHLGLYAYAPGRGRELRLTAAMNGIAAHAEPASVMLLVSPTTPGEVRGACVGDRTARTSEVPAWQRTLRWLGALGQHPAHAVGEVEVAKSIVGLQGPTYQAAQYLGKMMVAEAWVADRAPLVVSANVAGITHTRSLEHPLFLAGFEGAPAFGIRIFEPEQTRVITTLLMLHDLLNEAAPSRLEDPGARARAVVGQSVHGGVRSAPFALDPTIRVAAVLGLARRPGLLGRLVTGR